MNENSKYRSLLRMLSWLLLIAALIKLAWVVVELFWLPASGVEPSKGAHLSPLGGMYRLASNEKLRQPVKAAPKERATPLRQMKLLATYLGPKHHLAVIAKGGKSYVKSEGEEIAGYRIKQVGSHSVILTRTGKEYRLEILEKPLAGAAQIVSKAVKRVSPRQSSIRQEGDTTVVSRPLLESYTKNMDKIWKEIAIVPVKRGEGISGFRIRYIKHHSVFEKLGLRRGDIITAINGEEIRDYSVPMEMLQSIDTLDGLNLKIKRGKREMELNYEIE